MKNDDIKADLQEIRNELGEAASTKRKVKKVAKKVAKTETTEETTSKKNKSKGKTAEASTTKSNGAKRTRTEHVEEGMVSLRQLAEEAGIAPPVARAKLRASDIDRGDGRWKFEEGSKRLKEARKILGTAA